MTPDLRTMSDLVDPGGAMVGFLVPLFSDRRSNAPLVQMIGDDGTITGFEPYEVPDATKLPAPPLAVRDGDHAVHAFAFGPGDVLVINDPAGMEELARRIDDPVLLERPMLAVEVATFLRREDLLLDRALEVHRRLRQTSRKAADTWRDLSVLTTAVRRRLAAARHPAMRRLAGSVVATARDSAMEISGVPRTVESARVEELKSTILRLLGEFALLYPRPADGWRLVLTPASAKRGLTPDAAVLVVAEHAVSHDWWPALDLRVFRKDGPEFARVVEDTKVPLFVAYDSEDTDQLRRARGDWTVRDMHGLAIGSAAAATRRAGEDPTGTTYVVAPGIKANSANRGRGILSALELAIAAELDRVGSDLPRPSGAVILLRTQGMGSDPRSDGWAALYDRSWSLGLAPWRSLCIMRSGEEPVVANGEDWAADALLESKMAIRGPAVERVRAMSRATASMLVDLRPRTSGDDVRHRQAIVRLLERQRWSVDDHDHRDGNMALRIAGDRGDLDVRFAKPIKRASQETHRRDEAMLPDLRRLKGLVVTCGATPASVMAQLHTSGELAVDVRDLIGMDPRTTTPLSVVGHQLKRLVMGLHSPSRTRFLALLVRQAFEYGGVDATESRALARALSDADLGSRLHLTLRMVAQTQDAIVAQMRLVDQASGRSSHLDPSSTFSMIVTPDEVILQDRPSR